jgi:hypothetical protein
MKKNNIINRLSGLVEEGVDRVQDIAGDVQDTLRKEASVLARRARSGLREGKERAIDAEERMVGTVKDHPTVFVLAAIGLGFLTAAMLYAATEKERSKSFFF